MAFNQVVAVLEGSLDERPSSLLAGPMFADSVRGASEDSQINAEATSASVPPARVARPIRAESGSLHWRSSDEWSSDLSDHKGAEDAIPSQPRRSRLRRDACSVRSALRALRMRLRKSN
ncbi:hypothetical protein FVE85_9053 [Porphyridium purpureum]|uniref:Uncharacterized protein n=1 Tax=Porphyridium purpureum TaxID=35688 RepID=A0A5J4YMQ8_PORPP|nr:hypothetical protein FVE85_9053 [Porphyridium purpureum]|eukprot:POR5326..scf222_8